MTLATRWNDDGWFKKDPFWNDRWDSWLSRRWDDWPEAWPAPRDVVSRFDRGNRWWNDWPSDWPSMGTMLPRFSSHLDRFDRNWRDDPFWRDLYPRWAEPIFKDGLDVRTNIYNDRDRFAVEVDTYQFRPEELEVKTMDDTLLIEGRHEDVRDSDNYTKMYFVRKYQLPPDVHPQEVTSSIDSGGRLIVEARKPYAALDGRERVIPIMGSSKGFGSRSNSYSPRDVGRSSFRNGNNYNGNYNGYRSESRGADYRLGDSLRNNGHESRFRNEFSSSNNLTTNVPVTATRESYSRSASRSSRREFQDGPNGYYSEFRSSSRGPGDFPRSSSRGPGDFHRSSSRGPDYYRSSGEHLLRPEPELGERSASRASARSVRIQREERYN